MQRSKNIAGKFRGRRGWVLPVVLAALAIISLLLVLRLMPKSAALEAGEEDGQSAGTKSNVIKDSLGKARALQDTRKDQLEDEKEIYAEPDRDR